MAEETTPRAVAESYWEVQTERDLAVRQHYHAKPVFVSAGGTPNGRDEISTRCSGSFAQFPRSGIHIAPQTGNGEEATLDWDSALIDQHDPRFPLKGVDLVRVEGGKLRWDYPYPNMSNLPF